MVEKGTAMVYCVEVEVSPDLWLRLAVRDDEWEARTLALQFFQLSSRKYRVVALVESY